MEKKKEKQNVKPVGAGLVPAQNKGITLIALIITIIVMLILVGVTINVAINGGLFEKAETATKQTQIEAEKEELLSAVVAAIGTDAKIDFNYLDDNLPNKWEGKSGTYISPDKNTYTVDKNGKIEERNESKKEGNENIIQILNKWVAQEITLEEATQQLKQELSIEDEENVGFYDLGEGIEESTEDESYLYIYVKKVDEVYVANVTNPPSVFSYADEENYKKQYNLLRGIDVMREELANVFTGTTSAEMLEKFNNGTLDDYVLDKSDIISAIAVYSCDNSKIYFDYVTIYEEEDEATLLYEEHNYTIAIKYENGNYTYVDVSPRNLI